MEGERSAPRGDKATDHWGLSLSPRGKAVSHGCLAPMTPARRTWVCSPPGFLLLTSPCSMSSLQRVRLLSPLPSGLTPKAPASLPSPAGILSFCPKGGGRRKTLH